MVAESLSHKASGLEAAPCLAGGLLKWGVPRATQTSGAVAALQVSLFTMARGLPSCRVTLIS